MDAFAAKDGILLLVSCKSLLYTAAYDRGESAVIRNARTTLERGEKKFAELPATSPSFRMAVRNTISPTILRSLTLSSRRMSCSSQNRSCQRCHCQDCGAIQASRSFANGWRTPAKCTTRRNRFIPSPAHKSMIFFLTSAANVCQHATSCAGRNQCRQYADRVREASPQGYAA